MFLVKFMRAVFSIAHSADNPNRRPKKPLFADQNEDAGRQSDKVKQKNTWTEIQAEPQETIDDHVNPEQQHANVFREFHAESILIAREPDNPNRAVATRRWRVGKGPAHRAVATTF